MSKSVLLVDDDRAVRDALGQTLMLDGYDVTFGEMDRWEKNKISHRADAFAKLKAAFPDE